MEGPRGDSEPSEEVERRGREKGHQRIHPRVVRVLDVEVGEREQQGCDQPGRRIPEEPAKEVEHQNGADAEERGE